MIPAKLALGRAQQRLIRAEADLRDAQAKLGDIVAMMVAERDGHEIPRWMDEHWLAERVIEARADFVEKARADLQTLEARAA